MKKHGRTSQWLFMSVLLIILSVCGLGIVRINFSKNPSYYCTDMYSDMMYAVEVWNQKTIFPEGWVFGNQLYVVATPVLAALCYGFIQDPCIAMGMASTVMGLCVIVSFYWMVKPLFKRFCERLLAVTSLVSVVLVMGDPVYDLNGWQLFFTMCSYYACYAITAFLVFGCYLRSDRKWNSRFFLMFAIACAFSFGTGIQSLRQTAVMTVPLLVVEMMRILSSRIRKNEYCYKSTLIAGVLLLFNLIGVAFSKIQAVEKNEVFGMPSVNMSFSFLKEIVPSSKTPFYLFSSFWHIAMILFVIVCIYSVITILCRKNWVQHNLLLSVLLCIISTVVVWAVDIFTAMAIREIYYFMLFPMTAIGVAWLYSKLNDRFYFLPVIAAVLLLAHCTQILLPYMQKTEENKDPFWDISSYLEEQGITTVYSHWNLGEKIAIASDFRIQVGFWNSRRDPYNSVKYICNPDIFDTDFRECAYVVRGEDVFERSKEAAEKRGIEIQLLNYFPALDVFVFDADGNLTR